MGATYRMHLKRLFTRREFFFVVTILMVLLTGGYIENCLHYFNCPVDEVHSAAIGWIMYMNFYFSATVVGISFSRIFLYFLFGVLAALVYGDALYTDRREHILQTAALRATKRNEYIISGAAASFTGAFITFFCFFVLSQLLAFVEFPATSSFFGCKADGTNAWDEGLTESWLFPTLFYQAPYVHNLIYMVYSSFWAGIFAFMSYTASLFLNNRLLLLALPQLFLYAQFFFADSFGWEGYSWSIINYMYPAPTMDNVNMTFYILAPLVTLGILAVLFFGTLSSKKREVFL